MRKRAPKSRAKQLQHTKQLVDVLDQAEYMLRIAYRRTSGQGPEWARLEWLMMQTIKKHPIREVWNAITSKEEEFFLLLARSQQELPPKPEEERT